ncbi:MAG TPA: hypothetical protein VGP22_07705 [Albitalea sp.]|jgi:hypothetical protein|nr:hypothetical protein [Albitalea sp.]
MVAVALCSGAGSVSAQEAVPELVRGIPAASGGGSDPSPMLGGFASAASGFSLVELAPAGPNQRPRRALRMRFDSATRAMRSFGLEAEDCTSLLRSNTSTYRPDPAGGDRLRVSVSVAVNCKFF